MTTTRKEGTSSDMPTVGLTWVTGPPNTPAMPAISAPSPNTMAKRWVMFDAEEAQHLGIAHAGAHHQPEAGELQQQEQRQDGRSPATTMSSRRQAGKKVKPSRNGIGTRMPGMASGTVAPMP